MRKILFVLLTVLSIYLPAQENYKGKISLIFNDQKISVPINEIILRKENQIILNIRGERNDDSLQQMIALALSFNKLTKDKNGQTMDNLGMTISNRNKSTSEAGDVNIDFTARNEQANFSISRKGERVTWEINSLSLRFNISEMSYSGSQFKISGVFEGEFRSLNEKGKPRKEVARIEDGKFEIVI